MAMPAEKLMINREIKQEPSTERTRRLKERHLQATVQLDCERTLLYTQSMQETDGKPLIARRGKALQYVLSNLTPVIRDDELIVGGMSKYERGGSPFPEYATEWMELELGKIRKEGEKIIEIGKGGGMEKSTFGMYVLEEEERGILKDAIAYWKDKSLEYLTNEYYQKNRKYWKEYQLLVENLAMTLPPIALLEGHVVLDYSKILQKGVKGIISEIEERIKAVNNEERITAKADYRKITFWQSAIDGCLGLIKFAENYALAARKLSQKENNPQKKRELEKIAKICERVPANPPRTFQEALQSFWFLTIATWIEGNGIGFSPGRVDQYLYPYFKKDKEEGRITDEEAIELLECLRLKFANICVVYPYAWQGFLSGGVYANFSLGGLTDEGNDGSNELSNLILDSTISMQTIQPTLSVLYNDLLSEDFLFKAVECVKTGIGMPAWFGDKVSIANLLRYGVAGEDVRNWGVVGCVEGMPAGNCYPYLSPGFINCGKIFEYALNNGFDPRSGKQIGIATGETESMTFEEIKGVFQEQQSYVVKVFLDYWNTAMIIHQDTVPHVFLSIITDDCLEKGKFLDEGGARYQVGVGFASCGMIDVANSLTAIKRCVFEQKAFTMKELKAAIKTDYVGCEAIQKRLLEAPKFGNDDDYVDSIAVELYAKLASEAASHLSYMGDPYRACPMSVTTHPPFGAVCGALPSGRKAGLPLCDASASAYPGSDINGPTALINSASKIDGMILASSQLNLKFHPSAIKGVQGSRNLLFLIKNFIDRGGWHIQFNVVDAKILKDAQEHPENYRNLIVRVAGFSAYWVELSGIVQDEIIRRTEFSNAG